ncbi:MULTISPECIES: GGDEF domain-containing protein [Marinobacter]|jgi:diguanylate cyclase (GGDEF)-like protein|uniref:GGDEF domain-containing protein n=1 Tax=Marinobacter TaxID=2742 RepID=UPI0003B8E979|nr:MULTISPECIES: GGDEF domain-containing protein [unclassified Marinobacter]ERS87398.1 hypothetical protein Q672_13195 [Marinobacter sp. EVN1]MCE0760288.1 diguanylate cyclase [Marinobacter sp. G11]
MALPHFTSHLMNLRWPHRVLVVTSLSVIAAGMIAPPLFMLFGGTLGPSILATALITAVLVASPVVYILVMVGKIAQEATRVAARRNEIFQSLLESSAVMQKNDRVSALLDDMLVRLHQLWPDNHFSIVWGSGRSTMVRFFSSHGISKEEKRILIHNNHRLLESGQAEVVVQLKRVCGNEGRHWQFLPLHGRKGLVIGTLAVKGLCLSRADEEIISLFLDQSAAAIQNRLLTIELEKLANIDSLTGVYNHNYFNKELERQIELKEGNQGIDFSLLVVDVNGLKGLNDNLGHLAGNRLISAVADLLLSSCREEDCVARIGGDEFAVICPGTRLDQTQCLLERISRCSQAQILDFDDHEDEDFRRVPIQFSIGVASSSEILNARSVLGLADKRMYENKRAFYDNPTEKQR